MIGSKLKQYYAIIPIVYIAYFFGLFPYKWNIENLCTPGALTDRNLLSHSLIGLTISYVYLLLGFYVGYINLDLTIDLSTKYTSCFDDICWGPVCRNVCAHLVIVWVVYTGCISNILSIIFYRRESTLQCLNDMNRIIGVMNIKIPPYTSFLVILFLSFQVVAFVFQLKRSHLYIKFIIEFGPPYLLICITLSSACFVALILKLLELGYTELNNDVDSLYKHYNRYIDKDVIIIMHKHWMLTDLADLCSACLNVDLMFLGVCSTVRVIYFMFLMLRFINETIVKSGSQFSIFQSIIFLVVVVGPFVFICYRCNRVVQEEENSLMYINGLLLKARTHKDMQVITALTDFLEQVKVRQISFTACGLFTLNLRLICTIFGITMTYFIVLVQFKTAAQSTKN